MEAASDLLFNELDAYPSQRLRNLWPNARVIQRDITYLNGSDLNGFTRCHLFAGVGGWEYALQLAGWPAGRPAWTGSCPCQPFSVAGRRKGNADERHLWPEFRRLIAECRPPVVFGEQVAGVHGREWLGNVRADLEALGYAVGAADLCAASVSADHIRQRLYWAAALENSNGERLERLHEEKWGVDMQPTLQDLRRHWETEPRMARVANGLHGKVGRVRAYGNALVPQVAACFIQAFMRAEE